MLALRLLLQASAVFLWPMEHRRDSVRASGRRRPRWLLLRHSRRDHEQTRLGDGASFRRRVLQFPELRPDRTSEKILD